MLKRVVDSIQKDGFFETIFKIFKSLKKKYLYLKYKYYISNDLKELVDNGSFSTFIIFENNFGWHKLMMQRPQQIAKSLPKNTLIFYNSYFDEDFKNNKNRMNKIQDNVIIIDFSYYRNLLLNVLNLKTNKYLLLYSTDYIPIEIIKKYEEDNYKIIYEYVDDISPELCGEETSKLLEERHKYIVDNDKSYIVATATKLFDNIGNKANKILITNGSDYEHFKFKKYKVPTDLKKIKEDNKYLICYYGAIASWFDYDLIYKLAQNKDYSVILIGIDYYKTLHKSNILKLDNVYYLGKKEYVDLPKYGCNMDVFIIPFVINEITLSTSPVKAFEYMAMQKPIVTTALPECKKYESILYSTNHDEFIDNVKKAIKLIDDGNQKKLLKKDAINNNWKKKASKLIQFINSFSKGDFS